MKISGMSTAALIQTRAEIDIELEKRRVDERVKGRTIIGYFTAAGGDEHTAEFELHIGFDDGSKERWDFTSRFTDAARSAMNTFRKTHFAGVPEITREQWAKRKI